MEIDKLVVKAVLDSAEFHKAIDNIVSSQGKISKAQSETNNKLKKGGKEGAAAFDYAAKAALKAFAIIGSANGLKNFVTDMVQSNAQLYRLSQNLEVSVEKMGKGNSAFQMLGGQAGDYASAIDKVTQAQYDYNVKGNLSTSQMSIYTRFTSGLNDVNGKARDANEILKELNLGFNNAIKNGTDTRVKLYKLGQEAGYSATEMNALLQTEEKFNDALAKGNGLTKEQAEKAAKIDEQWRKINNTWTNVKNTLFDNMIPGLTNLSDIALNMVDGKIGLGLSKLFGGVVDGAKKTWNEVTGFVASKGMDARDLRLAQSGSVSASKSTGADYSSSPFFQKVIGVESKGNPNAYNTGTKGVPRGAVGFSGVMEGLTGKTLNEIVSTDKLSGLDKNRVRVGGLFQLLNSNIKEFLSEGIKKGTLTGNEKFTEDMQKQINEWLIKNQAPELLRVLKGESGNIGLAMKQAASVYASIPTESGKSAYEGPANKSLGGGYSVWEKALIQSKGYLSGGAGSGTTNVTVGEIKVVAPDPVTAANKTQKAIMTIGNANTGVR